MSPLALSHDEPRFDCYYFYGPSLKKILDGYTLVTGRPFFPPRWGLEFGDADCYNKNGQDARRHLEGRRQSTAQNDMPGGWILPNDGYGCGYVDLDTTIQELHKRGFYTGLWTEKGLDRIAHEVSVSGSRVMKLDVAWVGRGYQFAFNGMRDAYEGIEKNSDARGFVWTTCAWAGGQRYCHHLVGRPVGQLGVHPLPHPDGDRRGPVGLQRRHRRRGRHLRRQRPDAGARPAVEVLHARADDHQRLVEADQPDEAAVDLRRARTPRSTAGT